MAQAAISRRGGAVVGDGIGHDVRQGSQEPPRASLDVPAAAVRMGGRRRPDGGGWDQRMGGAVTGIGRQCAGRQIGGRVERAGRRAGRVIAGRIVELAGR